MCYSPYSKVLISLQLLTTNYHPIKKYVLQQNLNTPKKSHPTMSDGLLVCFQINFNPAENCLFVFYPLFKLFSRSMISSINFFCCSIAIL